jgi:hypothetical protein
MRRLISTAVIAIVISASMSITELQTEVLSEGKLASIGTTSDWIWE